LPLSSLAELTLALVLFTDAANANLPGGEIISMTVVCTVVLSIVGHGVSANPLVAALEARLRNAA
jgi:NhaP-type Na+/H+ or K+/H+ antiporter